MNFRTDNSAHYETTHDTISISKRKIIVNKRISNETSPSTKETYPYPDTNNTSATDQQHRKGSLESLASLQSSESQVSVESTESHHSHDNKPIPSTRIRRSAGISTSSIEQQTSMQTSTTTTTSRLSTSSRRTDSSSTGFSDGETDVETPSAVHSAPPVFNTSVPSFPSPRDVKYHQTSVNLTHSPNSEVWRKMPDYNDPEYPLQIPQKPTITRSQNVSQHRNLSETLMEQERLSRLERLNKSPTVVTMTTTTVKIDSPVRREQRRLSENEGTGIGSPITKRELVYSKDPKDYSYLRRQNSEGDATLGDNISFALAAKNNPTVQKEKSEPNVPVSYHNLLHEKVLRIVY